MNSLPIRPNLEHLKKQAKELLDRAKAGQHDELHAWVDEPKLNLATAQLATARRYGFASWSKLKAHVEAVNADYEEAVGGFLSAALENDLTRASAFLAKFPSMVEDHPWAQLAYGAEQLPRGLDPHLKGGPLNLEPLMICCYSGYLRTPERAAQVRNLAIKLLELGADPNVSRQLDDFWKTIETPLYAAVGPANDPELAEPLLAHGASPSDSESLYHSSEHGTDNRCLELVLRAGPKAELLNYCIKRKLDFEDPAGAQLYIDYGCDLNADPQSPTLIHALIRGRSVAVIELLLKAGANPNIRDMHELTAYQSAVRAGRLDVAAAMKKYGADDTLTDKDRFISKVMTGELISPNEFQNLSWGPADSAAVMEAAEQGNDRALELLMQAGLSPHGVQRSGASPIHLAALKGQREAVRVLASHGAALDRKDNVHQSLPIGFACWGSLFMKHPTGDYPGTVRVLLEHGSPHTERTFGSEAVLEVVQEFKLK